MWTEELGPIVDGHAHLPLDTAEAQAWMGSRELSVVNICVASSELGGLDAQREWYRKLHAAMPGRFAWVTSFDPAAPADEAIAQLKADFAAGACACKVWKNVGMEMRGA